MATVDTHVPRPCVSNPAISLNPAPPSLKSPSPEPERRPSNTPTEDDDDYVNGGNGYIFVLPGVTPEVLPATISSMQKNGSQQSLTSGDEDYVNGCLQKPGKRQITLHNKVFGFCSICTLLGVPHRFLAADHENHIQICLSCTVSSKSSVFSCFFFFKIYISVQNFLFLQETYQQCFAQSGNV
nr:uncharacterized protein LOC111833748 isoform X3 [Paramormyrops kingsleyae]